MDERRFETETNKVLARLAEQIEDGLSDVADIDLRDGILTIDLERGGQFVLNRHAPSREIWLSSPISGASHFMATSSGWVSTRGAQRLERQLADDLALATGVVLEFA
jgi:frataxin